MVIGYANFPLIVATFLLLRFRENLFRDFSNGDPLENLRINLMTMGDEKSIPGDRKAEQQAAEEYFTSFVRYGFLNWTSYRETVVTEKLQLERRFT